MFKIVSDYKPSGDQPDAIEKLVEGINKDKNTKSYWVLPVQVKLLL